MKTKLLAIAILICSSFPTWAFPPAITQESVNQIQVGQTTETDLVRLFGTPTTRRTDIRGQVELDWFRSRPIPWQGYLPLIGSFIGGLDIDAQQLYVLLSPRGTVLRFSAYSSATELRAAHQPPRHRHVDYEK